MVTPRRATGPRIALGGVFLDEVRIRMATDPEYRGIAYLAFPASRHHAHVTPERVTISTQAPVVVQLYATGVLPAVGTQAISLRVGRTKLGDCALESVESAELHGAAGVILLHFRKAPETRS